MTSKFQDLIKGSLTVDISPQQALPVFPRHLSMSGLARLQALFCGRVNCGPSNSTGIVVGVGMAYAVMLTGEYEAELWRLMKDKHGSDKTDDEIQEIIAEQAAPYGMLDGAHYLCVLKQLAEKDPQRRFAFRWFVMVLKGGIPLSKYKPLVRTRNAMHHPSFHDEITLYDEMIGLKEDYMLLFTARGGRDVTSWEVTLAYDNTTTNNTLKQKVNTFVRFDDLLIEVIGSIMRGEHPEDVRDMCTRTDLGSMSAETAVVQMDCRIYKRFITSSIKSSRNFMTAVEVHGELGVKLQIFTMYCVKEVFKLRNHKSVQPEEISEQFAMAVISWTQHNRFLTYIGCEEWPEELRKVRDNLLNTPVFDEELKQIEDDAYSILPSLKAAYRRKFPVNAGMVEAKHQAAMKLL